MNEEARETLLRQGIRYPFSNQIIFSLIMHDENDAESCWSGSFRTALSGQSVWPKMMKKTHKRKSLQ